MTKIMNFQKKIDSCWGCHAFNKNPVFPTCYAKSSKGRSIVGKNDIFPSWCPLPNYGPK